MHVVLGDVLDRQVALVHRDDVGVEGGRRVALVARDLHDRANSRQNLWPELKQLYAAFRHSSTSSSAGLPLVAASERVRSSIGRL